MTDQELLNKYHYHKLQLEHCDRIDKSKVGYGLGKKLLATGAVIGAGVAAGALGNSIADHLDLSRWGEVRMTLTPATVAGTLTGSTLFGKLEGSHRLLNQNEYRRWHEKQMRKMEHKARLRGLKLE